MNNMYLFGSHSRPPASLKMRLASLRSAQSFMNENSMRIKDLFGFVDKDRSGFIDMNELKVGLVEMATNGAEKFAKKREGLVAARKVKLEAKAKELDDSVKIRLKELNRTGALEVLQALDVFMHKSGSRIIDLFGKGGFDKSGDGSLGASEFFKAMKHIGIKCNKKGCKSLINFIDTSGDGEIEAYELEKILRRYRIDMIYIKDQNKKFKSKYNNLGTRPESDEGGGGVGGDNDFVLMMKAQAAKRGGLISTLKKQAEVGGGGDGGGKKKDFLSMSYATQKRSESKAKGKLPRIPPKNTLKIASGSFLDGTWLHSWDRSMNHHIRELER